MKKIFSLLAAVLFAGSMIAADQLVATLEFTDSLNVWQLPASAEKGVAAQTFTNGTYSIILEGTEGAGYRVYPADNDPYLILGKQGASLTLQAFEWNTTRIVVTGRGGASSSVKQNIYVGDVAVSTETVGAQGSNEYQIDANYQAAGNVYTLKVNSNHNTQIKKIEIYAGEGGEKPAEEPAYWIIDEQTPVAAGSEYVNTEHLSVYSAYGTTLSPQNYTIDSVQFGQAIQVRVDAWPTAEAPLGTEKSGSTSLVFNAKKDTKIALYYVRQCIDKGAAADDNKDLWLFDTLAITTKVQSAMFEVAEFNADSTYAVVRKGYELQAGHAYVLAAKGTTIKLLGMVYTKDEEVVPPTPIEPSEELPVDTINIASAIRLGMALDSMATDTVLHAIRGFVINAGAYSQMYHNQSWYMADNAADSSSAFQAYNCYPLEGADTLKVLNGDEVMVIGKLKKYYNRSTSSYIIEVEKSNAYFINKVDGDHSTSVQTEEINVAQALEIGAALGNNAVSEKMYKITGYVSAINVKSSDAYSEQYKNQSFWVSDDPNSSASTNADGAFYVYRGKPETEAEIPVGSKVEFTCTIKKYVPSAGGDAVIENADQNIVIKILEAGHVDTLNVAEAVEAALALGDNEESKQVYVVIGNVAKVKDAYSEQYKNISFYMTDEAVDSTAFGDLQVYRGKISEAEGKALAAGDRVMVVGKLKNNFYNDKNSAQFSVGAEVSVMWKQAIEQIVLTEKVNKVIMNGAVYIVRDGKLYDLRGAQVR